MWHQRPKSESAMSEASDRESPLPLSALPATAQGVVYSLRGGRHFRCRIASLGFTVGAPLKVVQNYGHGPILVSLRGTLVALGRGEAAHILVKPVVEDG